MQLDNMPILNIFKCLLGVILKTHSNIFLYLRAKKIKNASCCRAGREWENGHPYSKRERKKLKKIIARSQSFQPLVLPLLGKVFEHLLCKQLTLLYIMKTS